MSIAIENLPDENKDLYYWVEVSCANCDYSGSVGIEKHRSVGDTSCFICECETLKKKN